MEGESVTVEVTAQETGFNEDIADEAKPLLIDQSKSDAPDRKEKEIVECENDEQGIIILQVNSTVLRVISMSILTSVVSN